MTQISRPFQVVLAVFAVFVVVWFAALRNHALSTGAGAGSSPSVVKPVKPAVKPAAHATSTTVTHATGAHTRVGHSTSTTVTHAAGAHMRVAHTTVARTSRQTTSVHTGHGHTATVHTTVHRTVVAHTPPHTSTRASAPSSATAKTPAKPAPAKTLGPEAQVESQLKAGKTVLVLFWNPHGAEDVAVHGELPAVERRLGGKIAVHYASANQVGEYATITRAVQVNQTPTLLIVNPHGQATAMTGLTDAFTIEQAIHEAA